MRTRGTVGEQIALFDVPTDRIAVPTRQSTVPVWPLVALGYLAASLLVHIRVLPDLTGRAVGWVSSDSGLFSWWLHWTPWALIHGQNPLYTTWLNAPEGVNALWNTTTPVLALLLAPVTLLLGPVAAFNIGMILGPAASALAAYGAMRPWAGAPARAVAGGLYGFSPFVIVHGSVGHLNLVWLLLPPALLWALHELVVRRRPWRAGIGTGLALSVQTGVFTQLVALGAVAGVVAAAVLAVRFRHQVRDRVGDVSRAAGAAVGTWVLLCAYPLWLLLAGPSRPRGLIRDPDTTGVDAAGLLVPNTLTALHSEALASRLSGAAGELGAYLGVAVVALVVVAVRTVRSTPLRLAATTGALLALLSIGSTLTVLGVDTGLPLPFAVLHTLPVVGQVEAARLGPFVVLCLVLVVAIATDRALAARRPWVLALVAVAVLSWVPSGALATTDAAVPQFFRAGAPGLEPVDVVATWPPASAQWIGGADPMRWQSAAGLRFRLEGGYFIGGDATDPVLIAGRPTLWNQGPGDPVAARADLLARDVTALLVVPAVAGPDVDAVLRWTASVTGDPGLLVGDVWVFRPR